MTGTVTSATQACGAQAEADRKAPGRPRSARADEAIIEAVLDLLAEGTPAEALSIEAVAARAGVGKATIYRRWSNKEALLIDAVASVKGDPPPLSGTSVREDLLTLLRPTAKLRSTRAGQIVGCLMTELQRSPQLNRCYQQITEPRRELMRQVLRGGMQRGELRADLDVEVIVLLLSASMVTQGTLNWNPQLDREGLADRLMDAVWPALVAQH